MVKAKNGSKKADSMFGLNVPERHSTMRSDPEGCMSFLKPKNDETAKEKFRVYWESYLQASDKSKTKGYNPRLVYNNNIKAQATV